MLIYSFSHLPPVPRERWKTRNTALEAGRRTWRGTAAEIPLTRICPPWRSPREVRSQRSSISTETKRTAETEPERNIRLILYVGLVCTLYISRYFSYGTIILVINKRKIIEPGCCCELKYTFCHESEFWYVVCYNLWYFINTVLKNLAKWRREVLLFCLGDPEGELPWGNKLSVFMNAWNKSRLGCWQCILSWSIQHSNSGPFYTWQVNVNN